MEIKKISIILAVLLLLVLPVISLDTPILTVFNPFTGTFDYSWWINESNYDFKDNTGRLGFADQVNFTNLTAKNANIGQNCVDVIVYTPEVLPFIFNKSVDVSSQTGAPKSIVWDGDSWWITGSGVGASVFEYDSDFLYTGNSVNIESQISQTAIEGITWDGSFFYIFSDGNDNVYRFHPNMTYEGTSYDITAQTSGKFPRDITWDGINFWITTFFPGMSFKYNSDWTYNGTSIVLTDIPGGLSAAMIFNNATNDFYLSGYNDGTMYSYNSSMGYNSVTYDVSVQTGSTGINGAGENSKNIVLVVDDSVELLHIYTNYMAGFNTTTTESNCGNVNITGNLTLQGSVTDILTVRTDDADSAAATLYYNDVGDQLDIGVRGSNYVNPDEVVGSTMGVRAHNSTLFLATGYNQKILLGSTPDDNDDNLTFSIAVDPILKALVFQGSKYIRPVMVDGGNALVFQSTDSLVSGGFPFVWVAQDSLNDTIVTSWHQNGANNSVSAQMNSFGTMPKSWLNFEGSPTLNDTAGVQFLFNKSNYLQYCNYLQDNLSLIPEGCKYFADTTGRKVPLLFGGDLEVHRTATIHEGLTVYDSFTYIERNTTDFNLLWTDELGGKLHIRDPRTIEANISNFFQTITDFDDGTISPFVSESIAPEVGRDWSSIEDIECHSALCANAKGGNLKLMSFSASTTFSSGTVASSDSSLIFWLTTDFGAGDEFSVILDDNQGNVSTIYSTNIDITDQQITAAFPVVFENKSNVTTTFSLDGSNVNRQVWVDVVQINSTPATPIIINETYQGGQITFGQDVDTSSECKIFMNRTVDVATQLTENNIQIECENVCVNGNCNLSGGGGTGTTNHAALTNLEFSNSGHLFAGSSQELDIGSYDFTTSGDLTITGESNFTENVSLDTSHLNIDDNYKICMNSNCSSWICHNTTDLIFNNGDSGVSC